MRLARGRSTPPGEAGFVLIEVLVSAVIVVLISTAVFTLLTTTGHAAAEERHRSEAYALAQEDQARLRSLRVPLLNHLSQTRIVTLNGTPFTVESSAVFVNDKTGTSSCGQGTASADYVKIASTVSWSSSGSHGPVKIASIVAPPTGSLDPSHGTLTIFVANAHEVPIAGVGLSGTGAGTFNGTTNSEGCAQFPDQPSGNYTLTPSGVAGGLVEQNGNPPGPMTIGVVASSTSTVQLLYDLPGSIPVAFTTMSGGKLVTAKASSIIVFNTGMKTAKVVPSESGNPELEITAKSLFPFTSPDTVYAGACETNNPNKSGESNPPDAAALASVLVPAGGTAAKATIQLPALTLTVKNSESKPINEASVKVIDTECEVSGKPLTRTYKTNALGQLAEPGLPWSTYTVCASAPIKTEVKKNEFVTVTRHVTKTAEVKSTAASGTPLEIPILSSSPSGEC